MCGVLASENRRRKEKYRVGGGESKSLLKMQVFGFSGPIPTGISKAKCFE